MSFRGLLAPLLLLSSGAAAQGTFPRIPAPTGSSPVGRVAFHWVDSTRGDPSAPDPSSRREMLVYVWYPAEVRPGAPVAPYFPDFRVVAAAIGDSAMRGEFGSATIAIGSGRIRSHSVDSAPVRRRGRPFPVVIFSPGFDESLLTYSAQVEDLASHGYVVVGIEHPSDAFAVALGPDRVVPFAQAAWDSALARPGGAVAYQLAQVPVRAADMRFVLDRLQEVTSLAGGARFAGTLDLERVGAFGHSLGGVAAAHVCRDDPRFRACLNEDADDQGRPFDGGPGAGAIRQPFLFFATGHSIYASPRTPRVDDAALRRMKLTRAAYDSITGLYQHNQDAALAAMPGGATRVMAEAEDFTHRTFIDLKLLDAEDSTAVQHQLGYLQLVRRYVRAFFDESLRGATNTPLDRQGVVGPVVTIEHFPPR